MKWNTDKERLLINNNNQYVNGDILEGTSLNAVIDEAITALDFIEVLFGSDLINVVKNGFETVEWRQKQGVIDFNDLKININLAQVSLFAEVTCDELLRANVYNDSNQIRITITESGDLHQSGPSQNNLFEYTVKFYFDQSKQKQLWERSGKINYTYLPSTPGVD